MLETLETALTSRLAIGIIVQIVIAIWALPRIQRWRERIRQSRYGDVWDAVMEAVQETYREKVRPQKIENGGTLKPMQRREARQTALAKVKNKLTERHSTLMDKLIGRAPKLLGELAEETIISLIEDAVAEEKRKGQS